MEGSFKKHKQHKRKEKSMSKSNSGLGSRIGTHTHTISSTVNVGRIRVDRSRSIAEIINEKNKGKEEARKKSQITLNKQRSDHEKKVADLAQDLRNESSIVHCITCGKQMPYTSEFTCPDHGALRATVTSKNAEVKYCRKCGRPVKKDEIEEKWRYFCYCPDCKDSGVVKNIRVESFAHEARKKLKPKKEFMPINLKIGEIFPINLPENRKIELSLRKVGTRIGLSIVTNCPKKIEIEAFLPNGGKRVFRKALQIHSVKPGEYQIRITGMNGRFNFELSW